MFEPQYREEQAGVGLIAPVQGRASRIWIDNISKTVEGPMHWIARARQLAPGLKLQLPTIKETARCEPAYGIKQLFYLFDCIDKIRKDFCRPKLVIIT